MAASDSLRMGFLSVRTLAFGGIGVGYAAVGTASTDSSRMILVQNLTDQTLMFSIDGATDHFPLAAQSFLLVDMCTNRTMSASGFYLPQGTLFSVKHTGVAPTLGSVFITFMVGVNK